MTSKFDIFLSYHADSKELVKSFFHAFLTDHNFKPYMYDLPNEENISEQSESEKISEPNSETINESKCFLCFLTYQYSRNEQCKKEILKAARNKMQIFLLKLDEIELSQIDDLSNITSLATFNFFDLNSNDIFSSKAFSLLINSLQTLFKIKSYLLSDSSKSNTYFKVRPLSPLPPSEMRKMPGFEEIKPIEFDDGSCLSTDGKFLLLANGDSYNGKFLNKKYFGFSHYKWSNGDSYEGDWLNFIKFISLKSYLIFIYRYCC